MARRWKGLAMFVGGIAFCIADAWFGYPGWTAIPALIIAMIGSRMMNDYAFGRTDE